jgi:hypothetical protein
MAPPSADPLSRPKTRELYDLASQRAPGAVFTQQDLSAMGVADTPSELLSICQDLLNAHHFQMMTGENGEILYKLRSEEEASKYEDHPIDNDALQTEY